MKKTLLLIVISSLFLYTKAQVVLINDDMPNVNQIYKLKLRGNFGAEFDFNLTGQDFIWDISDIDFTSQRNDTFVKVSSTPLIYNVYFSNSLDPERKATIATPKILNIPAPGISVEDVYYFYKETSDKFSEVGFGATVNDIQMPVKYDQPDVWYKFPITFGASDTSLTSFSLNIPSYGYFGEKKKRINKVDGWGTLITHHGSFPVIRIKSEMFIEDTIYYNAYSQGYKFNRTETEYKWLGAQIGVPMLAVFQRMNSTTMEVFDSLFMNTTSVLTQIINNSSISVFPNPAQDYIILNSSIENPSKITYSINDNLGKQLFFKEINNVSGFFTDKIDLKSLNLKNGIYFINLKTEYSESTLQFIVN